MHPASNRHALATITAGRWKGRRLRYPRDGRVRPTMRRTKESLFSSLGPALEGCVFADLYAGAGAVGIEALSRGARHVHFVEVSRGAVHMLLENLAQCGADPGRFTVHQARVAAALGARPCPLSDATVVFADPPYDLDANVDLMAVLAPDALPNLEVLVLEHRARQPVEQPAHLALARERRFGDTMLSYLVPAAADDIVEDDA